MTRYADPQRCPDCGGPIRYGADSCPACGLSLAGPYAAELFRTLTRADELLTRMRAPATPAVPALTGTPAAQASPAALRGAPLQLPPTTQPPTTLPPEEFRGTRLSGASVPRILLGLGALCLLVAALVFLAVTWSVMDVAGRTATLVGFTIVTAGLAAWMARQNLRAATEALSVVALGLLTFDMVGARDSGWLGDITTPGFLVVLGTVLVAAGTLAALAVRRTPAGALAGAEVVAALGLAAIATGSAAGDWFTLSAALTLGTVMAGAAAFGAHRLRLSVLTISASALAGYIWVDLVATSLVRALGNPSARELWLELEVWPLLASALLVAVPAAVRRLPDAARVAGLALAELLLAVALLVPFTEATMTRMTLAVLAVLATASVVTWLTKEPWSWGTAATTTLGGLWMLAVVLHLSAAAVARVTRAGSAAWTGSTAGELSSATSTAVEPWLLPLAVLAVVGTGMVLARSLPVVDRLVTPLADLTVGVAILVASVVGAVALYPVPVWLVLALLLLPGAAFVARALRVRHLLPLLVACAFLGGATVISLHDEWLTLVALLVGVAAAGAVLLRWEKVEVSAVAGGILTALAAGLAWTSGALVGAAGTWTAATALLVLAALSLGVPALPPSLLTAGDPRLSGLGVEVAAGASAFAVAVAGLASAPYTLAPTWTAVYLTLAGAAVSAVALLREDRRMLGWLGGFLLVAASWVRLWDVGVEVPEAYTLPSALALGVVGLVRLRRDAAVATVAALSPCLSLGLVPSLLWALNEPVSLRSLLLGAACLALVVAGVRVRWTAPLVFGAAVGTLLVLRLATPLADAVPRWVLIGAAGALLIGMGVTWERRVQQARAAVGYVRRLR